ncbi:MAG: serine/threonine protein kinase [Bacteriovoracaceae bacterium]|nr:serine/threonine protein kinase [Bacteriovoracaceae bacterium]
MADENKRERFGRYLILDHLVDGGMAKICRARFIGEQADKVVAIKMVQPQYSKDESFKTMFMDEIGITFDLIHPNIVQTYDYGVHMDQLYVAMEYCDGRNLKEYLDKLKERKFVFPVEISVYIVTQICQGLHYAHTYTNKLTGKSANIIHRDISPHNIMLTFDGSIKVIDFGIAKADTNSEATQAGTIKGKLSYLAPEYLEGEELDPRYDEFAVGITLWEMLCSRKLFKASNDLAVLKKIQECKVPPPSSINPNVPKELDEIVMKALHKDRNKRYEDLDKFNRALMKFLYTNYSDFNATDLSYFAKELFKEDIKADREKLFEFGKIDIAPYIQDWKNEQSGGGPSPEAAEGGATESDADSGGKKESRVLDFGFEEEKDKTLPRANKTSAKKEEVDIDDKFAHLDEDKEMSLETGLDKMKKKKADAKEQEAAEKPEKKSVTRAKPAVRKAGSTRKISKPASTTTVKTKKSSTTKTGTRTVRVPKKEAPDVKKFAGIAVAALVLVYFGWSKFTGDDPTIADNPVAKDRKPADDNPDSERTPVPTSKVYGKIQLLGFDKYKQKAYVNGKTANMGILSDIKVEAEADLVLRIQKSGRIHFIKKIRVPQGDTTSIRVPEMPPASYGYLVTSRDCLKGKLYFSLFGEDRVENLPIPRKGGIAFPAEIDSTGHLKPKTYEVFYQKDGEGIQRRAKFTVTNENDSIDFCESI